MIVLDTSALCEIVRRTPEGDALLDLIEPGEEIASCDLIRCEAASVFRKLARIEKIDAGIAQDYLLAGLALVDTFHPIEPLQTEAFRESIRLDHSTYDMFFFVLARRLGATLFTTDRKLVELCTKNGVDVVHHMDLASLTAEEFAD